MIDFIARSDLDLETVCARLCERFDLPPFYIQVEGAGPDDAWDYVTTERFNITHVLDYSRKDPWKDWFSDAPEWNYKFWISHPREQEMLAALPDLIEGQVRCS